MLRLPIYLDNNSTTRTDPRVVEAMLPYFTEYFGNPASRNHSFGWQAEDAVEKSREQIAQLIGASAREIVFTSGSTESNNLAIKGVAQMYRSKGDHIITSNIEHKAVLDPCKRLEKEGFRVTYLPVDKEGMIHPDQVREAIDDKTILVSLMYGNNEIGTYYPIGEIGKICKEKKVLFHTDATQAAGRLPIDVEAQGIDLLSLSAHNVYGPKGIGCLYVRRKNPRVRLEALIDGGGQERGMRSGTLATPNIVGMGAAMEFARTEFDQNVAHMTKLRDKLHQGITSQLRDVELNGHPKYRLPSTVNLSFAYVEGEALMMGMKDIAVSSGSACTSASLEPSYVLKALGVGDELAHSSLRFGVGRFNTEEEIDYAVEQTVKATEHLRAMSPLAEMVEEGIDLSTVQWSAH
jgi:cysteine desulfurase